MSFDSYQKVSSVFSNVSAASKAPDAYMGYDNHKLVK